MALSSAKTWQAAAAYLYVLHLDSQDLAWEYLRRHPRYRRAWAARSTAPEAGVGWGVRSLEDPSLDARQAQPSWLPGHVDTVQLLADEDPGPRSVAFAFWNIPGCRQLFHDGRRLLLVTRWPGSCRRWELGGALADGAPYLLAVRVHAPASMSFRQARVLAPLAAMNLHASRALTSARPSAPALLEMHTLQALDATLAGASQREIAMGLFGRQVVVESWHADCDLRARVRRLVRRGRALMDGGYRRLALSGSAGGGTRPGKQKTSLS